VELKSTTLRLLGHNSESQTLLATTTTTHDDADYVSVSGDDTPSTWLHDGRRSLQLHQIIKHTNFLGVSYLPPDSAQVVVCDSDRIVTYSDALEGKQLRGSRHQTGHIQFSLQKRFSLLAPLFPPSFQILLL
jgi:hypothetical protein